jgi:hypothetical protein
MMIKMHFLVPCQLRFTRVSLVRITPLRRYQAKTFVFNGIFIDQIFVFLKTGVSDWINALYIESTENLPLSFRFYRTTSDPCNNWTRSSRWSKVFQATSLGPMRSRLKAISNGEFCITVAKVSDLWRTILYKAGYCSRRVVFPNHLSSQNLIWDPSLIEKDVYGKKNFLVTIRLSTRCWVLLFGAPK